MKFFSLALVTFISTASFAAVSLDCKGTAVGLDESSLKMKVVFNSGGSQITHEGFSLRYGMKSSNSRSDKYLLPSGESVTKTWLSLAGDDFAYSYNETSYPSKAVACTIK